MLVNVEAALRYVGRRLPFWLSRICGDHAALRFRALPASGPGHPAPGERTLDGAPAALVPVGRGGTAFVKAGKVDTGHLASF